MNNNNGEGRLGCPDSSGAPVATIKRRPSSLNISKPKLVNRSQSRSVTPKSAAPLSAKDKNTVMLSKSIELQQRQLISQRMSGLSGNSSPVSSSSSSLYSQTMPDSPVDTTIHSNSDGHVTDTDHYEGRPDEIVSSKRIKRRRAPPPLKITTPPSRLHDPAIRSAFINRPPSKYMSMGPRSAFSIKFPNQFSGQQQRSQLSPSPSQIQIQQMQQMQHLQNMQHLQQLHYQKLMQQHVYSQNFNNSPSANRLHKVEEENGQLNLKSFSVMKIAPRVVIPVMNDQDIPQRMREQALVSKHPAYNVPESANSVIDVFADNTTREAPLSALRDKFVLNYTNNSSPLLRTPYGFSSENHSSIDKDSYERDLATEKEEENNALGNHDDEYHDDNDEVEEQEGKEEEEEADDDDDDNESIESKAIEDGAIPSPESSVTPLKSLPTEIKVGRDTFYHDFKVTDNAAADKAKFLKVCEFIWDSRYLDESQ